MHLVSSVVVAHPTHVLMHPRMHRAHRLKSAALSGNVKDFISIKALRWMTVRYSRNTKQEETPDLNLVFHFAGIVFDNESVFFYHRRLVVGIRAVNFVELSQQRVIVGARKAENKPYHFKTGIGSGLRIRKYSGAVASRVESWRASKP